MLARNKPIEKMETLLLGRGRSRPLYLSLLGGRGKKKKIDDPHILKHICKMEKKPEFREGEEECSSTVLTLR